MEFSSAKGQINNHKESLCRCAAEEWKVLARVRNWIEAGNTQTNTQPTTIDDTLACSHTDTRTHIVPHRETNIQKTPKSVLAEVCCGTCSNQEVGVVGTGSGVKTTEGGFPQLLLFPTQSHHRIPGVCVCLCVCLCVCVSVCVCVCV